MQTYSETKGTKPFDWRAFLNQETISDEDAEDALERAMSWVTCACGNQCDIIPRDSRGTPNDYILRKIGGEDGFYSAISRKQWKAAMNMLDLIEVRSAYLIQQEKATIKKNLLDSIERARFFNIDIAELIV